MGEYDYLRDSLRDTGLSDDEIEKVIENEKRIRSMFNHAIERDQASKQSAKGQKKKGHEGPLKQLLRDIIGKREISFDEVMGALATGNHLMVDEFDGEFLTFAYKSKDGEETKTVGLPAIRRAYREIIKTMS